MKVRDIINELNAIAPLKLAESWDKVGLQVGRADQTVKNGLVCIDLTKQVIQEAIAKNCQMVIAYHPPIFSPVKSLNESEWKQRVLLRAVEAGIAIYTPHTALDATENGMCDWLCDVLGEGTRRPLIPTKQAVKKRVKCVVFVPAADVDNVRQAMTDVGAGNFETYSACTFETTGTGRFIPEQGANPTVGKIGKAEAIEEVRLETVCDESEVAIIVAAMQKAHPYEMPAYDLYPLMACPQQTIAEGTGRIVELKRLVTPHELAERLQKALNVPIKLATGDCDVIRTIAVCPGAGGELFTNLSEPADAYVTGEMRHHDVLDLTQRIGRAVFLAGHTHTERPFLPRYIERLQETLPTINWELSERDAAPYEWIS